MNEVFVASPLGNLVSTAIEMGKKLHYLIVFDIFPQTVSFRFLLKIAIMFSQKKKREEFGRYDKLLFPGVNVAINSLSTLKSTWKYWNKNKLQN